jgi:thioredoxin-like negative regulator of GroEL
MAIKTTTSTTFQADVLDSTGLVLVAYYIEGAPGVEGIFTIMTMLDEKYTDSIDICKIECSAEEQLLTDNLVNVIPMVVVYKNGTKLNEFRQPQRLEGYNRLIIGNM